MLENLELALNCHSSNTCKKKVLTLDITSFALLKEWISGKYQVISANVSSQFLVSRKKNNTPAILHCDCGDGGCDGAGEKELVGDFLFC